MLWKEWVWDLYPYSHLEILVIMVCDCPAYNKMSKNKKGKQNGRIVTINRPISFCMAWHGII